MNTDVENFFDQGRQAARNYYKSQAFSGLTRFISPEVAIRLFFPPVDEQLVMIAMPLPKNRQKWIAGFKKEQQIIMDTIVFKLDDVELTQTIELAKKYLAEHPDDESIPIDHILRIADKIEKDK